MKKSVLFNRVNEQPPILMGLSESEFLFIVGAAAVLSTAASCFLFALFWSWVGGFVLSIIVTPLATKYAGSRYARMKTGKPDNYYPLLMKSYIDSLLDIILRTTHTIKPGTWSTIRRNRYEGGE